MKLYLIEGKIYAVIGEEIYEQLPQLGDSGEPTTTLATHEPHAKRKYSKAAKGKKATKGSSRIAHCKNCDGYGHFAKTCPDKKPEAERTKAGEEEGLIETADVRTQVQELKAEGKTSIAIASKLGITLAEVNKHW